MTEDHSQYMRLAVDQGKKSEAEDDRPHPKVGATIVRDGKLLGSAYRGEKGSGDHAEYTLFEKKLPEDSLEDATLFTTLEPCTTRRNHKPCSEWIIEKGISKVVIGMLDPDPSIYSKGTSELKRHNIEVSYFPPDLREEIEADNQEFIAQFHANPRSEGEARFDYTNNDGIFTVGSGDYMFETDWTKASDASIHMYDDPQSIEGIAVALDAEVVSDISDASIYDMSSRDRTIQEGQFVVLKNANGYFAALQVMDVKDRTRSDDRDELLFKYWILTDKSRDFSFAE